MKKYCCILLSVLCLGLTGCSGSSDKDNPEMKAITDKLEQQDYKVLVALGANDDYRDLSEQCYDEKGDKTICQNEPGIEKNDYFFSVVGSDYMFYLTILDNEKLVLTFMDSKFPGRSNMYQRNFELQTKAVRLAFDNGDCVYYTEGSSTTSKTAICEGTNLDKAKKIMELYENEMKNISITEDEFVQYLEWYKDNITPEIRKAAEK